MQDVEALWAEFSRPIVTADDYIASLRGRQMNVFFMGERVPEPVDHPVIRPSINAMAETYRLATERPAAMKQATRRITSLPWINRRFRAEPIATLPFALIRLLSRPGAHRGSQYQVGAAFFLSASKAREKTRRHREHSIVL